MCAKNLVLSLAINTMKRIINIRNSNLSETSTNEMNTGKPSNAAIFFSKSFFA
jgi:hypothetical protein